MSISFQCPICREEVTSTPEHSGKFLNCPGCSKRIPIPKELRTGKKEQATAYAATDGEWRTILIVVAVVGGFWLGGRWLNDWRRSNSKYVPEATNSDPPVQQDVQELKPDLPELPKKATAEQITSTFKTRVYLVRCDFTEARTMQGRLGPHVERAEETMFGSGVLIAHDLKHGLIVTNRHVVDPGYLVPDLRASDVRMLVKNPIEAGFIAARIVAVNQDHDLALLLVSGEWDAVEAITVIRQQAIHQGERAVALGNPHGFEFFTSTGIISGKAEGKIGTTCPISPGSSGGPLFLTRHGYLVGITTLISPGQNLNFAEPAEAIVANRDAWSWRGTRFQRSPFLGRSRKTIETRLIDMVPLVGDE